MTTTDDTFTEESAERVVHRVAMSHLSIELGHLYMDDFHEGAARLSQQFRRVAPWARTAAEDAAARLPEGAKPRISTCFLIDDYFTRFSSPPEVVTALVAAAADAGLTIDYVARESGCASAGGVDLAGLVLEHIVNEPADGTNGGRPSTQDSGWLTNGVRSPSTAPGPAMGAPRQWRPPRESAARNHSIFVDIELWSTGPHGDLWSCPFLAAVWQLQRLGLVRNHGKAVADPVRVAAADLPLEWDAMPSVVQLTPKPAPMRAYRTFTAMDGRFLPIELAVRTIISQVAIDPLVAKQAIDRARSDGLDLPVEVVERIGYAFV